MKDYASLKRKHTGSRTIAMIMAVLLIVEMCSLTMLFSRVIGFSSDNRGYVISLTEGAERSAFSKVDTAATGFIEPTYVADPDIYWIEPEDKINMLDFGYRVYDKNQAWTTTTNGEVFHLTYDQDKDEWTVISDGTFGRENAKVIAPGTSEDYKFTIANQGSLDLKYLVYLEAWIDAKDAEGNDLWIPLNSKFYNKTSGKYFGAGDSDWHDYEHIDKTGEISPIAAGDSYEYHVEWEWPFERFDGEGLDANDAYDTMLGDLAAEGADLRAYIRVKTVAWIVDYWHIYTDVIEGEGTTDADPKIVEQYNDETSTITAVPAEGYEFVEWVFDDDDIYEIIGDGSLTDPTLTIKPGSDIHAHAKFRLKETEPASQPATQPESQPATQPQTQPATQPQTQPATQPQTQPATQPQTQPATQPQTQPATQPQTQPATQPQTQPATQPETQPATQPQTQPATQPETQPVTEPATQPETQPQYWIVDTDVIEGDGTTTPPVSDPEKVKQGSGDTVTITATPDDGYEFVGWEIDGSYTLPEGGSLSDPTLVIRPGSDVHAHAKFRPIPKYWIVDTDVIEGEGNTVPTIFNPAKVEQGKGETVEIIAIPVHGWEFVEWVFDDDSIYEIVDGDGLTDPTLTIKPGSDIHAHAKFRPKYWIVDTDVIEGDGTTTPPVSDPVKVQQTSGDTVTITATPGEGYEFVGWEIDGDYTLPEGGSLTDPTLVIKPASDVHAHAKFRLKATEPASQPVTQPVTEPATQPETQPVTQPVTEPATQPETQPVTQPVTEPATQPETQPQYWIVDTDVIEGKGTTTPPVSDPVKVEQGSGDTVSITATPDDGYEFVGWEIDGDYTLPEGGSLTDPNLIIKPNSDIHAHAKFKPITPAPKYWIVDADIIEGEGTVSPTVDNPVKVVQNSDETVTIHADPADGYEFVGWEIDGDFELPEGGSLTDPTLVIKPGSDVHAHAKFRKKTVPTEPQTEPQTEPSTVTPSTQPTTVAPTTVAPTTVAPTSAPAATTSATPQTGDFTHNLLWIILSVGAFIALIVLFFVYRKVKKRERADS